MDLHCRFCGEPFDVDEFHGQEVGSWKQWVSAFRKNGCGAVDACFESLKPSESIECKRAPIVDEEALDRLDIMDLLLGDDIDGLSSF